jgi:DNA-binding response OmpR family regulator
MSAPAASLASVFGAPASSGASPAINRAPQAAISALARFAGLRLTRKERDLFAVLLGNPRKCISREALLRTVWGYGEGAKTRTVDVHVLRLRRKLGPEHGNAIKTIVRQGYCWDPDM